MMTSRVYQVILKRGYYKEGLKVFSLGLLKFYRLGLLKNLYLNN